MNFAIGLVITVGCILGGYAALGGHLEVLLQPYEFVIIAGSSLGIFIVANATSTIKDCGKACLEAVLDKAPKPRDFLDVLSALHALMRELRAKSRSEVEAHFDNPEESEIFRNFPKLLADKDLVTFICDYGRLIIIGNARTHEIEALMDEEIETLAHDRYKPVHTFQAVADGLPALGIVAAVLGIIHAMGALDQSPEILGGLHRRGAGGHLRRHLPVLRDCRADRPEGQGGPAKAVAAVYARQAKSARVHERGDAAGGRGVRPQDHSLQGAANDRRGRERDHPHRRRGRHQGSGVSIEGAANEVDHGARKLQGAMLEHSNLAIERMPGLGYALNRFIAEAPLRLSSLIARPWGGSIEEVRATTLFRTVEDCSGLTAAFYASVEPEARLIIALDERIDHLIVSSIFGEVTADDIASKPAEEADKPRTAIEATLIEAFARALGAALEAAFAPIAAIALSFERLQKLSDPFVLGRRDNEAAAARFSLQMHGGACECLVVFPQAFLLPFRDELARDPDARVPAADRRWSRLMEFGVQRTGIGRTFILSSSRVAAFSHSLGPKRRLSASQLYVRSRG